jgi:hypothetical protein
MVVGSDPTPRTKTERTASMVSASVYHLRREGYADSTLTPISKQLLRLAERASSDVGEGPPFLEHGNLNRFLQLLRFLSCSV